MLTAWGFGSALGPLLIAYIRESTGKYSEALYIIAVIMLVSSAIPFIVHPPSEKREFRFADTNPRPSRP
jgi:OFA family oxalate/formate antiporter-like MFS transporter